LVQPDAIALGANQKRQHLRGSIFQLGSAGELLVSKFLDYDNCAEDED
jgi:hypothetical protein